MRDAAGRPAFPVLAVCGYGRSGKDTFCEWLRDHAEVRFSGGCSYAARFYMAKRLGLHSDEAYARRHEDRQLWYEYLNEFRRDDPSKLIQLVLQTSDIVCGVRDREEMFAARREGLVDLLVWVHRPQAPLDTTVTYSRSDCDIVIDNDGTIPQFHTRIRNLAKALGLLTEPGWNTSEEAI